MKQICVPLPQECDNLFQNSMMEGAPTFVLTPKSTHTSLRSLKQEKKSNLRILMARGSWEKMIAPILSRGKTHDSATKAPLLEALVSLAILPSTW